MKKLLLAIIALASAFAISSCCDQSYCPGNRRCDLQGKNNDAQTRGSSDAGQASKKASNEAPYGIGEANEIPYRWDHNEKLPNKPCEIRERQHRRW